MQTPENRVSPRNLYEVGEALEANLREQARLMREQIETALRMRHALVHGDLAGNQKANIEAESQGAEIDKAETQRRALAEAIFNLAGIVPDALEGPAALRCEKLYPALPPDVALRVAAAREELQSLMEKARGVWSVNAVLCESARGVIRTTIGLVTSMAVGSEAQGPGIYGAHGKRPPAPKQARNLVNRRV